MRVNSNSLDKHVFYDLLMARVGRGDDPWPFANDGIRNPQRYLIITGLIYDVEGPSIATLSNLLKYNIHMYFCTASM